MRHRHKKHKQYSPVEVFKTQIRRRHREQIRKDCRNKLYELEAFDNCLTKLCWAVHGNLHILSQSNHYQQKQQNFRTHNKHYHPSKDLESLDLEEVSKLISHLNYYLNQMDSDQLQQILLLQEKNREKDHYVSDISCCNMINITMRTKLQILIRIYIPHIVQTIETDQNRQKGFYRGENAHNFNPYVLNADKINNGKLKKQCISILCILSTLHCLLGTYSNPNQQYFSIDLYAKFRYYEPIRLICQKLMEMIDPERIFYECLIGVGNILHGTIMSQNQNEAENKERLQYFFQALSDIQIQSILYNLLVTYNAKYQEKQQQEENVQNDSTSSRTRNIFQNYYCNKYENEDKEKKMKEESTQDLILWFLYVYTKYLFVEKQRIYQNELLRKEVQSYVVNLLQSIAHNRHKNEQKQEDYPPENPDYHKNIEHIKLTKNQCKKIKYLNLIIDYCEIFFDNIVIINTILPLLRYNWEIPEIAKLWKLLSFKSDYKLPSLISVHHLQVLIPRPKDKSTIKNKSTKNFNGEQEYYSEGRYESEKEQTNTQVGIKCYRDAIEISSIVTIIQEIFDTIMEDQRFPVTVIRDIDLIDGIYNVLLEIQLDQAVELWGLVYINNEKVQERLIRLEHLRGLLERIENFIKFASQEQGY